MALGKVANYIKNVAKSVVYATDDTVKNLAPAIFDYKESNAELAKGVYGAIKDYRGTYQRAVEYLQSTKVYEAGTAAARNAFDDLLTGNFYNRERANKMDAAAFGMDLDFGDDAFAELDKALSDENISDGDKATISTIESTAKASSSTISKSVIEASKYNAEVSKMNTSILFSQNERLFGRLQAGIGTVNDSINNIFKFQTSSIQTHIDNSTKFYDVITKNTQEQTAILKEMLEMQRQEYQAKQKFEQDRNKRKKRQTFSDIVNASGAVNFSDYFGNIGTNFKNWFDEQGGSFLNMNFGDGDTNPLMALASAPLQFIPMALIDAAMGPKLKTYLKKLDKSVSGMFGTFIARMNAMADNSDNNVVERFFGRILGVRENKKSEIDPGNYNKGAVAFDGITRKAIVDVIPTYLAKIESAITGANERYFNYNTGRFADIEQIKREYEDLRRNAVRGGFSEVIDAFGSARSSAKIRFQRYAEQVDFNKDMQSFFETIYNRGGYFNPNRPGKASDYGVSEDNFKTLVAMYKELPKEVQMKVASEVMEARNRYATTIQGLEDSGTSIYSTLFAGRGADEYIKRTTAQDGSIILNGRKIDPVRDSHGYTQLEYLRAIAENTGNIMMSSSYTANRIAVNNAGKYKSKSSVQKGIPAYTLPDNGYKSNIAKANERMATLAASHEKENEKLKDKATIVDAEHAAGPMQAAVATNTAKDEESAIKAARSEYWLSEAIQDAWNNPRETAKKKMNEEISGEDLRKDFLGRYKAAETISGKISVIVDKIYSYTEAPSRYLSNMLIGANNAIYDFFFEKESEAGAGKRVKGFFNLMIDKTVNLFDRIGNGLNEKIIEPLRKKLGLDEKYKRVKDWFKGSKLYQDYLHPAYERFFSMGSNLLSEADKIGGGILDDIGFRKSTTAPQFVDQSSQDAELELAYLRRMANSINPENLAKVMSNITAKSTPVGTRRARRAAKDAARQFSMASSANTARNTKVKQFAGGTIDYLKPETANDALLLAMQRSVLEPANERKIGFANGARQITRGGITAISPGEMIIPAEMNPFNQNRRNVDKSQEIKNEQGYINNFSNAFTRAIFGAIPKNATGNISYGEAIKGTANEALKRTDRALRDVFYINAGDVGSKAYDDIIKNPTKYVPEGIAGGAIGGILGLITGLGPMAGLLIGAGASVANSSEAVKNWLFGEKVDEEGAGRKGGALMSRDTQQTLTRMIPDLKKFGLIGAGAGLIGLAPFGIVGGLTLGAAAAYARNNKNIMNALFGDTDGAFLNKERKAYLKEKFPAMALGTAATFAFGPFGLVGSALIGSAAGIAASSDEFKETLLGKEMYDGKRHGGLLGTLRENFADPLVNFSKSLAKDMKDYLKNDIMKPLAEGIGPLTRNLAFMVGDMGKALAGTLGSVVGGIFSAGGVLGRYLNLVVGKPLAKLLKPVVGVPLLGAKKLAGAAISAPFKAIGKLGEWSQKRLIETGRAYNMDAASRLAYASDKGFDYAGKDIDTFLNNADYNKLTRVEALTNQLLSGGSKRAKKAVEKDTELLMANLRLKINNDWTLRQIKLKLLSGDKAMLEDALKDIDKAAGDKFENAEDKRKFFNYVVSVAMGIQESASIAKNSKLSEDKAYKELSKVLGTKIDRSNIRALSNNVTAERSKRYNELHTATGQADEATRISDSVKTGTDNIVEKLDEIKKALLGGSTSTANNQPYMDTKQAITAVGILERRKEKSYISEIEDYYGEKFSQDDKIKFINNDYSCSTVHALLAGKNIKLEHYKDIFKLGIKGAQRIILLMDAARKRNPNIQISNLAMVSEMSNETFAKCLELIEYGITIKDLREIGDKRIVNMWYQMRAQQATGKSYEGVSTKMIKATLGGTDAFDDRMNYSYSYDKKKRRGKTLVTENGIVRTIISTDGEETYDLSDSDTKETLAYTSERLKAMQNLAASQQGLVDIFSNKRRGKDAEADKADKKEGFFSKLLGKAGSIIGAIGGGFSSLGKTILKLGVGAGKWGVIGYLLGSGISYVAEHQEEVKQFVTSTISGLSTFVTKAITAGINLLKETPSMAMGIASSVYTGVKNAFFGKDYTEEDLIKQGYTIKKDADGINHYFKDGVEVTPPTSSQGLMDTDPLAASGALAGVGLYLGKKAFSYGARTISGAKNYYDRIKKQYGKFSVGNMIRDKFFGNGDLTPDAIAITDKADETNSILSQILFAVSGGKAGRMLDNAQDILNNKPGSTTTTKKKSNKYVRKGKAYVKLGTNKVKAKLPSIKTGRAGAAGKVVSFISGLKDKMPWFMPSSWVKTAGKFFANVATKVGPKLAASASFIGLTGGTGLLLNLALSLPALYEGYNNASNYYGIPEEKLSFLDKVVAGCANGLSEALFGIISTEDIISLYTPSAAEDNEETSTTQVAAATPSTASASPSSYQSTIARTPSSKTGKVNQEGSIAATLFGVGKYGRGNYFKQTDPRYAGMRFNVSGDTQYQNMADSGCGPVAAVNAIYGRGLASPVEAAQFALKGGYKEKDGGTRPEFFSSYFNAHGKQAQYTNGTGIIRNLKAGYPVVMMGQSNGIDRDTPYGTGPHYVTATGIDGRGNMIIQDPQDPRNDIRYKAERVLAKTKFGVAARGKFGRGFFGRGPANDNEKDIGVKIWNLFVATGKLTEVAIAGIMGNMYAESNLQPRIVQGGSYTDEIIVDGKTGYGLCQWTSEGRQKALKDFAKQMNKSSGDAEVQVQFCLHEMKSYATDDGTPLITALNNCTKPYDAAIIFHRVFERSADNAQMEARRGNFAEQLYNSKGKVGQGLVTKTTYTGSMQKTQNSFFSFLAKQAAPLTKIYNSIFGGSMDEGSSDSSADFSALKYNSKSTNPNIQAATNWANSKLGQRGYGPTGCTSFVADYLAKAGVNTNFLAGSKGNPSLWVPELEELAKKAGKWKEGSKAGSEGDVAIIETNNNPGDGPDHAVIADGSGWYFGNSSSRNMVVRGNLGSDFGSNNVLGYIATGDPATGAVASGNLTRSQAEVIGDAGPTSANGKFGRGKFGRGFKGVPIKNLFGRANELGATQAITPTQSRSEADYTAYLMDIAKTLHSIDQNIETLVANGGVAATAESNDMGNAPRVVAEQRQNAIDNIKEKLSLLKSANGLGQLPFSKDFNNISSIMAALAKE